MTDETRDPREAVLEEALVQAHNHGFASGQGDYGPDEPKVPNILARLDAADPLRALLPEVVDGFAVALDEWESAVLDDPPAMHPSQQKYEAWYEREVDRVRKYRDPLTRIQALTTEEPTDG